MEPGRYADLSTRFGHLLQIDREAREQEIDKLQAVDPSLATELTEFFQFDEQAQTSSFLEYSQTFQDKTGLAKQATESDALPEIDGYKLLRRIGQGGMGDVYQARQAGTNQLVALKTLRGDWLGQRDDDRRQYAIEQFQVEVEAAAKVKHPNIVGVLHTDRSNGQPYFAMEFIEGESLKDTVKRTKQLGNHRAARYLADAASAVHLAHQYGILHRDIKPANILLDNEKDIVKIADFGVAELASEARASSEATGNSTARIAGTPAYMAPELLRDYANCSVRSDVYSLGATLYELLTGIPPQRDERYEATPPSSVNNRIPQKLEAISMKCLAVNPEDRYASAGELAKALTDYLESPKAATYMATTSNWVFVCAFAILLFNLAVYAVLQWAFIEPVAWMLMFCMYPPVFVVVAKTPAGLDPVQQQVRTELWATWLGKAITAVSLCIALRVVLARDPQLAIQTSYIAFAGLSAMVSSVFGASFWRGFYYSAVMFWLAAVFMVVYLDLAPVLYAICASTCVASYGVYLRQLGRELADSNEHS